MTMEAQSRGRPSLEIRTDYTRPVDTHLRSAFSRHRGPQPSATPATSKALPSPMQPSSPRYDVSMRQHERAMVESLDARRGLASAMSPATEQSMSARVNLLTVESPWQKRTPSFPATAPNTPMANSPRRQSMVQETRSMLLSGMSPSQAGAVANRKLSAPREATGKQQRPSMALLDPDRLQAWGHVYLGDPSKADVLVAPKALRRPSGTDQGNGKGNGHPDRLTIRAHVRPKGRERKPFLIERSIDPNVLRAMMTASPVTPVRSPLPAAARVASSLEPASLYRDPDQSAAVSVQPSPAQERLEGGADPGELTEAMKQNILHLGGTV
ncbi:hypothetical protein KVR01_010317 [Diaporthe batatas]|uniref:uncharacterized protein n=1 Tax=Diaporthe batatas TaxID=748121 RepID=UPI001D05246B|nr:uncharacterized protein KVR01_010317 [Diaporthe batatas]KAG8159680.1 hypothetical protein KVR01_010317 [Diaporthe batatas]